MIHKIEIFLAGQLHSNRTLFTVALVPLLLIMLLYGIKSDLFRNHYDDAYITYRYAVNLAMGNGLVFTVGEKTDAASSPLYTFILATFYKIGLTDLELISISLSILSAVGIFIIVYKSILALTKKPYLALFFSLITNLHGFISGWAVSGMESVFFTFLITAFIYQYYFKKRNSKFLLILTMISILLTRMESVLLLVVWFFSELYKIFIARNANKKAFILQTIFFISTILGLYIFQYKYYGSILSNALQFKRIALYYQPNPLELFKIWGGTSLIISLLAFFSLFLPKPKNLIPLYVYIFLSFISFATGPYSDGARYSIHVFPSLVILSSLVINHMIVSKKNKSILFSNRRFIIIFLLSLVFLQTLLSSLVTRYYMISLKKGSLCRREIGSYINRTLKSSDYVLSSDLGMIAYQAINVRFIDLAGLTSKDVLKHYQKKKTIDDILLYKKPEFLAGSFYLKDALITPKEIDRAEHILLNKDTLIVGMNTYTNLPFQTIFNNILYQCSDGKKLYAIVDLKLLYSH